MSPLLSVWLYLKADEGSALASGHTARPILAASAIRVT